MTLWYLDVISRNIIKDWRLHSKGFKQHLTVNKDKCELNKPSLEFYGYVFGEKAFWASPSKCEMIKKTPAPTNVSEVKSCLAMTNYVSRFIPNYSTTTEPLRALLK